MVLYLTGEVNGNMVATLSNALNDLQQDDILVIYFASLGGSLADCLVMVDMVNMFKDHIVIKGFDALGSAGFIFFYSATCKKVILPYTIGLAHYGYMSIDLNQGGSHIPNTLESYAYSEFIKTRDEFVAFYKSLGMTKKEISDIQKGLDVYFSTERLQALLDKNTK
jgi:ATP-dependent protease ClpP protease subunit